MMYIKAIEEIPIFVGRYFNVGKISMTDINEFSDILKNSEFFFYDKNKYATKLKYKPVLVYLYIKYSKLDRYGHCRYEEEIDLFKSISNEIYKLRLLGDEKINVTIDYNEEDNLLILNVEEI